MKMVYRDCQLNVVNSDEKSSETGIDMFPLLTERNRSMNTFSKAVSVL